MPRPILTHTRCNGNTLPIRRGAGASELSGLLGRLPPREHLAEPLHAVLAGAQLQGHVRARRRIHAVHWALRAELVCPIRLRGRACRAQGRALIQPLVDQVDQERPVHRIPMEPGGIVERVGAMPLLGPILDLPRRHTTEGRELGYREREPRPERTATHRLERRATPHRHTSPRVRAVPVSRACRNLSPLHPHAAARVMGKGH